MISLSFRHSPIDIIYQNLQLACAASGYKVVTINREAGIIEAEKRKVFGVPKILQINIKANKNDSAKINVIVRKNNLNDLIAEQKITDIINKYF